MVVYKAILDMYAGVAFPWMPSDTGYKLRGDKPIGFEGAICDMTVRGKGLTLKVSDKVVKTVEAKFQMEATGDFVGTGTCTFEPTEDGKTKA